MTAAKPNRPEQFRKMRITLKKPKISISGKSKIDHLALQRLNELKSGQAEIINLYDYFKDEFDLAEKMYSHLTDDDLFEK